MPKNSPTYQNPAEWSSTEKVNSRNILFYFYGIPNLTLKVKTLLWCETTSLGKSAFVNRNEVLGKKA